MLKAIGKAINIRIASSSSNNIPIVILGNSPITKNYCKKVDMLKTTGVVQGFYSLNPTASKTEFLHSSEHKGFQTIFELSQLEKICSTLLSKQYYYFSAMLQKNTLGSFITLASKESTNIKKAEVFLKLLSEMHNQEGNQNEK